MGSSMTERVFESSLEYLEEMPREQRKNIGQFFTPVETARYMASMFIAPSKTELSILDPGAGSGILTAAVIERLQNSKNTRHIHVTCYETSTDVLPLLNKNLAYIQSTSRIPVDYEVIAQNYITAQSNDFTVDNHTITAAPKYDWIICNPPYKKIAKDAVEALSMPDVCYGAPNLYFLFMAMGLFNLHEQGEMVYIIPRSWTSGAYFQKFREYFLDVGTIKQIHLFVSRDKVFEKENVLQETIIIKVDRTNKRKSIKLTCSYSNSDFNHVSVISVPYSEIVVGSEKYVYLVTTEEELKVIQVLNKWKDTLLSLGLKMRTGLTVDFRCKEYLRNNPADNTVPLIYAQHIRNGKVIFPVQRGYEYITTERAGLLQNNKNYLIVKRFSSKEETRRLQCGVFLSSDFPQYKQISTQNKVNFIEGIGFNMTQEQVYGLYVLFNSTLYDQYYRILNGSTQVNSTEVNAMPVPPLNVIEQLGSKLKKLNDLSVNTCDKLLGGLMNEQD